jgi:hypothetical protein
MGVPLAPDAAFGNNNFLSVRREICQDLIGVGILGDRSDRDDDHHVG